MAGIICLALASDASPSSSGGAPRASKTSQSGSITSPMQIDAAIAAAAAAAAEAAAGPAAEGDPLHSMDVPQAAKDSVYALKDEADRYSAHMEDKQDRLEEMRLELEQLLLLERENGADSGRGRTGTRPTLHLLIIPRTAL